MIKQIDDLYYTKKTKTEKTPQKKEINRPVKYIPPPYVFLFFQITILEAKATVPISASAIISPKFLLMRYICIGPALAPIGKEITYVEASSKFWHVTSMASGSLLYCTLLGTLTA